MKGKKGPAGVAGGMTVFFSTSPGAATLYYASIFTGLSAPLTTLDTSNELTLPSARTLRNLRINAVSNFTKDVTFTLYKNGVATAITVTVASGSASGSDLTHTVAFAALDRVSLAISHTAVSPGGGFIYATLGSQ